MQHEYTPAGLSVNVLKNKDRAMAQVLQEAIKGQDFDMYLALLKYTKSGGADTTSYYGDYKMMDVDDEEFNLYSFVGVHGERPDISVPIDESGKPREISKNAQLTNFYTKDIYPADTFEGDADSESVEEATGNEGASMELRYHRAVIVLWPKECWIDIACSGDVNEAVKYMAGLTKNSASSKEWENVKRMAERVISRVGLNATFLEILLKIGDEKLIQTFLQTVKHHSFGFDVNEKFKPFYTALDQCLTKFGWKSLAPSLAVFAKSKILTSR